MGKCIQTVGSYTDFDIVQLSVMILVRRKYQALVELKVTPWNEFFDWLMAVESDDESREWSKYDLVLRTIDYSTEYMYVHNLQSVFLLLILRLQAVTSTMVCMNTIIRSSIDVYPN